jgi:hypothetical protein
MGQIFKPNIIQFITSNSLQWALNISYNREYIEESVSTKFLDLHIDNILNWTSHADKLNPKLREYIMQLDACVLSGWFI